MQWLRKKDGFTLVEMIVTLAIMAILLAVAGNALLFGNRMYTETEVKNREKSIGDTVFKAMENQLVYATKIEILPNDRTTQYDNYFKIGVESGVNLGCLMRGEAGTESNVFGLDYYDGYQIGYTAEVKDQSKLHLVVNVKKGDAVVYTRDETMKNLKLTVDDGLIKTKGTIGDNPIIGFAFDLKEETTYDPLNLLNAMRYVASTYIENKNALSPTLKEVTGGDYANNDLFSAYVAQVYCGKLTSEFVGKDRTAIFQYWPECPTFPEGVVMAVDKKIKEKGGENRYNFSSFVTAAKNGGYKMMVYYATSDNSCYVYVPTDKSWASKLIYNHEDGYWYFYYGGSNYSLGASQGIPWETLKQTITSSNGWIKLSE